MNRDYFSIALQYATDVCNGTIVACKYVKQACARQLKDLDRENFKYTFDVNRAEHICAFIEKLPHIKGEWSGKCIVLEPWQIFILTTVFGWVDEHGYRRFKSAYNEIPRKNAKSTLSSGVALYLLLADGEAGAEVYSAATTRDQARIVWQDAKRMVDKCPGLQRRFGVSTSSHSIFCEKTASALRALSRDQGGNLDGLNVHGGIIDELHAHKTREVFDVIETATGARRQPLLWKITTAGFNRSGICYEQRSYSIKLLSGVAVDEEYFAIIYTIDEGDDWTDQSVWQKANPNWGISVNPDDIARKARKAMTMSAAQNNFLTKHLNVWVNADTAWMDMVSWERCGNPELTLDDFASRKVYMAIDLASKIDIASVAFIFPGDDGEYSGFVKHYLPELTVENTDNSQYSGWANDQRIIVTPGAMTDYQKIEDDIREAASTFDVAEVAYDPWQANYLASRLMEEGLPMIELRQTVQNISEPMKELEALVVAKKYSHDACPVMNWMVSNVVCHIDAKDNIYPRKEKPENKIDGVVATIMALGRAKIAAENQSTDIYVAL